VNIPQTEKRESPPLLPFPARNFICGEKKINESLKNHFPYHVAGLPDQKVRLQNRPL
jgi:hypothetical protein